jgi:hypothetical protein
MFVSTLYVSVYIAVAEIDGMLPATQLQLLHYSKT